MNEPIKGESMIMKNMPQMAQFVYDFYNTDVTARGREADKGKAVPLICTHLCTM